MLLDVARHGLRNALRFMWKKPLQATVVVATLTIALGANTTLFSVARAILIRDLPYDQADRVVYVRGSATSIRGGGEFEIDPEFSGAPGIESAAIYMPDGWAALTEIGTATRIKVSQTSANYFEVLGVSLLFGPGLTGSAADEAAAVLSQALWQRAFGSDPSVLDRSIVLNGRPYRIVGVAPPEVGYPDGTEA